MSYSTLSSVVESTSIAVFNGIDRQASEEVLHLVSIGNDTVSADTAPVHDAATHSRRGTDDGDATRRQPLVAVVQHSYKQ